MSLPSASELIKKYGLDAKRSLGQNFILDKNYTDKIAKSALDNNKIDFSKEIILEVGPGPATLTRSIAELNPKKLILIEKDQRCIKILEEIKEFYKNIDIEIINEDALKINELEAFRKYLDCNKIKIISNLPYNIGTMLVLKWVKISSMISSMTLMLQKEVVDRIVADNNDKNYGRISVILQNYASCKKIFEVNKNIFTPQPKVTSAIVKITPFEKPRFAIDFEILEYVVFKAFNQRRKMIRSSLKDIAFINNLNAEETLKKINLDPTLRAENLTLKEFYEIASNVLK